ncbi:MAG: CDC48 family AAA ATPase [Desulfobacterales bacterium]|nr:CDC48 family AAA ATPase [Desulfobacterales bacterium]
MTQTLTLKVTEALGKDMGRCYARMGPEDLERLGASIGDTLILKGKKTTLCKAMPAYKELRGRSRVQLDGITRENAGTGLDETIRVEKIDCLPARSVRLLPVHMIPEKKDMDYIGSLLDGLPVVRNDRIRTVFFGSQWAEFMVESVSPDGPVMIHPTTELFIGKGRVHEKTRVVSYEDIGGLKPQLRKIREMIELPLKYPEVFERLGISAPKGVLLHGPPGCGKTLIARAIAHETDAGFYPINGPEVIHKFYGQSEAHLRQIFEKAAKKGPGIVFIDEIDAIAPRREAVVGDVEKRVVAQLLALMDGLNRRQNLIVIAATNLPDALDPALRRPGRFDREIVIPVPDRTGRKEILEIHSRGMPLAEDVDMDDLSGITHGFIGADLEALCREAAMKSLRGILPRIDFSMARIPYDKLSLLRVTMADFSSALKQVEPSAIREVFVEVPKVRWDQVGGLEPVKKRLQEVVEWPLKFPDIFQKAGCHAPKGILLSGPPGCGKTLLVKAVASESRVNFISVKGPELMSKYVGASEKGIRNLFQKARQAAPCIVFFDEIDALVTTRQAMAGSSHVGERVVSQLLTEMDGIEALNDILVIGATNRPDMLDPAVRRPGRFDEELTVHLPDQRDRQQIFNIHLADKSCEPGLDLKELSVMTRGFSGADICLVCNQAAMSAVRRAVEEGAEPDNTHRVLLTQPDLFQAVTALAEIREKE